MMSPILEESPVQLANHTATTTPAATPPVRGLDPKTIEPPVPQRTCRLPNGLEVAQLSSPQTNAIYREIWDDDVYRRHGVDLDGLDEGAVIFDVGANIGLFSLFAHQQVRNPRV